MCVCLCVYVPVWSRENSRNRSCTVRRSPVFLPFIPPKGFYMAFHLPSKEIIAFLRSSDVSQYIWIRCSWLLKIRTCNILCRLKVRNPSLLCVSASIWAKTRWKFHLGHEIQVEAQINKQRQKTLYIYISQHDYFCWKKVCESLISVL